MASRITARPWVPIQRCAPSSFAALPSTADAVLRGRVHESLGDFVPPLLLRRAPGFFLTATRSFECLVDVVAAFDELRPALKVDDRYRDKYVAIHRNAVVDCDLDKFQLVRRLMKNYPDDVLFVGHVQIDEPPVDLPSPEIES